MEVIIIIVIYKIYKLVIAIKKDKIFANTPLFNEALAGYYVKFKGVVVSPNQYDIYFFQTNYAFYRLNVDGHNQVKLKKPSKGYKTVTTSIFSTISHGFFVNNQNQNIFVEVENPKNNSTSILNIHEKSLKSDSLLKNFDFKVEPNRQYKGYIYSGDYLKKGETVTIYGRLIKKDNRFVLTETYNQTIPLMIHLGDSIKHLPNYSTEVVDRIVSIFGLSALLTLHLMDRSLQDNYFLSFVMMIIILSIGFLKIIFRIFR